MRIIAKTAQGAPKIGTLVLTTLLTAALQLAGCAPSKASQVTYPLSGGQAQMPVQMPVQQAQLQLQENAEPPAITAEMIAADASNPDVVVSGDNPWVVVPSFRMAIHLPGGWYRQTPEQILAGFARSYDASHQLSQEQQAELVRSLRGAADRHPSNAPVMGLIPSVRVAVGAGGGVPPEDFCARLSLPASRQFYPDARLTASSWIQVAGRRAARCSILVTANTVDGAFAGAVEQVWFFGESHHMMIASIGNTTDPVLPTLQAVVASIRRVDPSTDAAALNQTQN